MSDCCYLCSRDLTDTIRQEIFRAKEVYYSCLECYHEIKCFEPVKLNKKLERFLLNVIGIDPDQLDKLGIDEYDEPHIKPWRDVSGEIKQGNASSLYHHEANCELREARINHLATLYEVLEQAEVSPFDKCSGRNCITCPYASKCDDEKSKTIFNETFYSI